MLGSWCWTVVWLIHYRHEKRCSLKELVRKVAVACAVRTGGPQPVRLTVMDTCDGRLAAKDLVLLRQDTGSRWRLVDLQQGMTLAVGEAQRGAVKKQLEKVAGGRPLIPWGEVAGSAAVLPVMDGADKQVARLHVASLKTIPRQGQPCSLGRRVWVEPLRGYQKIARQLLDTLGSLDGMTPVSGSVYAQVLAVALPEAARLASGSPPLIPDMSVAAAWSVIMERQLAVMEANEVGVLADVHLECLHDFRVALRRARTVSKALAAHLPREAAALGDGFRQLSAITGPLRDLDVHLADFPAMLKLTPQELAQAFDPMLGILRQRRSGALAAVLDELHGPGYQQFKAGWRQALQAAADYPGLAVRPVAAEAIWKTYKRIIRDGGAITPSSPPEALHALRKKCKSLRYLLEFFQDFAATSPLIKALKNLQDCLGAHQDFAVQHALVQEIRGRLSASQGTADISTIAALVHLESALVRRQEAARAEFAGLFQAFASRKTRARFHSCTAVDDLPRAAE